MCCIRRKKAGQHILHVLAGKMVGQHILHVLAGNMAGQTTAQLSTRQAIVTHTFNECLTLCWREVKCTHLFINLIFAYYCCWSNPLFVCVQGRALRKPCQGLAVCNAMQGLPSLAATILPSHEEIPTVN